MKVKKVEGGFWYAYCGRFTFLHGAMNVQSAINCLCDPRRHLSTRGTYTDNVPKFILS